MKILLPVILLLPALIRAQPEPSKIKVHKEIPVDSAFFSMRDFAIYTKHNDFNNRYKSVKHFEVDICYRGQTINYSLKGNYLPQRAVSKLYRIRAKDIVLKFHSIQPMEDSAYAAEPYKLAPFEYHIKKKLGIARWRIGAWSFPLPFLQYRMPRQ